MAGNGERLDDRSAVLPAEQYDNPRSTWTHPRRPVRRALIGLTAAYLLTLAVLPPSAVVRRTLTVTNHCEERIGNV